MARRYRLRTLLIVLALGPPVLAGLWFVANDFFLGPLFGYGMVLAVISVFFYFGREPS